MSALYIILSSWLFFCQKLLKLIKIGQSYNKNNFDCFLKHGVQTQTHCRRTVSERHGSQAQ